MRRKILLLVALAIPVIGIFVWSQVRSGLQKFQVDADILRLQHLKHYGQLIEEYHQETGKYPLQGRADVPIYVHVANDQQIEFSKRGPPTEHEVVSFAEFVSELETALGHTVEEFYDPQYRPVNKPNFYIYMIHGNDYFFAVHLHQPFPFAKRVAEHYYKAEISNAANSQNKALSPEILFNDTGFNAAIEKPIDKSGFFKAREKQYLDYTKRQ